MLKSLEEIVNIARDRKNNPAEGTYTNKLLSNKSLSKAKVLEEINELIEAVDLTNFMMSFIPINLYF